MSVNTIEVENLAKQFGTFTAVDHISFQVKEGEIFGFLGANGAGKSTTIRMLCGLLQSTAGTARVGGFDINTQSEKVKESIGYMSQRFSLYEDLTVDENINFFGKVYGLSDRELMERKKWVLEIANLRGREKSITGTLSGGWKQRLALAACMLHEPQLLLLDEPTAGVDIELRKQLWNYVRGLNAQGATILLTTHYLEEAEELCDRIAIINHGRLIACDETKNLMGKLDSKRVVEVCPGHRLVLRNIPDYQG